MTRPDTDVTSTITACNKCAECLPSQSRQPLLPRPTPQYAFQDAADDIFMYGGHFYLIYVDALTKWCEIRAWNHMPSSSKIIGAFHTFFVSLGVPSNLYSDNRSQFASDKFRQFAKPGKGPNTSPHPTTPARMVLRKQRLKNEEIDCHHKHRYQGRIVPKRPA